MSTLLKFPVSSFRRIPNPYAKSSLGDPNPEMFVAICDVKDLPDNIPMGTNPREQKLTTAVPKKIKASLLDETSLISTFSTEVCYFPLLMFRLILILMN